MDITLDEFIAISVAVVVTGFLIIGFIAIYISELKTRRYENEYVWDCAMIQRESSCQPVIDPWCCEHQEYGVDDEHCRLGKRLQRKHFRERLFQPTAERM